MIDWKIKSAVTLLLAIGLTNWLGCDHQTSKKLAPPETSSSVAASDRHDDSKVEIKSDNAQNTVTESKPLTANPPHEGGKAAVGDNTHSPEMGFGLAVDYAQLEMWRSNLRQIGDALREMVDDEGVPAAYTVDDQGKPLLSWRVRLLPYLGHAELHKQFRFDEPWNSKHNLPLVAKMPSEFRAPGSNAPAGKTNYVSVWSVKGFIVPPDYPNAGARDSSPNRIKLLEIGDDQAVIWTKPEDFEPDTRLTAGGLSGRHGEWSLVLFGLGHDPDLISRRLDEEIVIGRHLGVEKDQHWSGEPQTSMDYLARARSHARDRKRRAENLADLDKAIELDNNNAEAFFERAEQRQRFTPAGIARETSDAEANLALDDLNEAIRLDTTHQKAFVLLAQLWLEMGDRERAISDFATAIQIGARDPFVYSMLSTCLMEKEDYTGAIEALTDSIRLEPTGAPNYFFRGGYWRALGDLNKAIADFSAAAQLDPDPYTERILVRGVCWRDAGEFDKALADFEKVAHAEDPYPSLGRRLDYKLDVERARLWATCPIDRFRDGKRAVEAAKRAIATYPFEPVPWYFYDTLAAAYAEAGDFMQAKKSQARAIGKAKLDNYPVDELFDRFDLYKNNSPYHQGLSDPSIDWRGSPFPPW